MRLLLRLTALGTLLACGHYAPPERADAPREDSAQVSAPSQDEECEEKDEKEPGSEP